MKAVMRSIIAGVACAWLLAGCGGGASSGENSSDNDDGQSPRTVLQVSVTDIPDEALRACVNRLAREHEWQAVEAVDTIVCGDVEIRSIQGLQAFSGLRTLKIAAPRLPVSEIPLLASLPLEDYQRKPFYKDGDESLASNAQHALKKLLQDGNPLVEQGDTVTFVVLVSDDPAAVRPDFTWQLFLEDANAIGTPIAVQWEQGSIRTGAFTEVQWLRVQEGRSQAFSAKGRFDLDQREMESVYLNWLNPSALISQIEYIDPTLKACVDAAAAVNQWLYTAQVTTLNCAGQGLSTLYGIETFKLLRRLELQDNQLASVNDLSSLTNLEYVDLRNNPLRSELPENLDSPDIKVFSDPPIDIFNMITLSEQNCGIRIDNFDSQQQYWLMSPQLENNHLDVLWMLNLSQSERRLWSESADGDCMPLSELSPGAWVVVAGDQTSIERWGRNGFVLAEDGMIQQMFFWSDVWGVGEIVLSGGLSSVFYSAQSDGETYRLHQWNTQQWRNVWSVNTDYRPLYVAGGEVYLTDSDVRNSQFPKDFVKVNGMGQTVPLPDRPVAGIPMQTVSVESRLWVLGVRDDWGYNPSVMVWDATTNAWELKAHLPVSHGNYYGFSTEGRACIRTQWEPDSAQFCWSEVNSRWEEVDSSANPEVEFNIAGKSYRLYPEYIADWIFISSLVRPSTHIDIQYFESFLYSQVIDVVAPGGVFDRGNQPLLQQYDLLSQDWVPFGPPLFGFATRADAVARGSNLLVTFPKSIVRYPMSVE